MAAVTAAMLLVWPAQAQTNGTVLVDQNMILNPGDSVGKCYELGAGTLFVAADSPPGRTGESAFLEIAKRVDGVDTLYLRSLVTMASIDRRYSIDTQYEIEAGSYCIVLSVTKNVPDPFDPNRPERPTKHIYITAKHQPR